MMFFFRLKTALIAILLAFVPYAVPPLTHGARSAPMRHRVGLQLIDSELREWMVAPADLKFDVNTELSARRTGMAFQRTRLAKIVR